MSVELVLWALPKGSNDRLDEKVLYTQATTMQQIDAIKARASQDGWHGFRVQRLDLMAKPDFTKGLRKVKDSERSARFHRALDVVLDRMK